MEKSNEKFWMKKFFYIFLTSLFLGSCVPYKKLIYLQDDSENPKDVFHSKRMDKTIQPGDKLYITVYSIDEKTASLFSNRIYSGREESVSLYSYSVNEEGNINFPFLGLVNLKGLSLIEAQKEIEDKLGQYVTSVTITVRFVGNNVFILGEVNRPGAHPFYDDKINILEAISYAGGITTFGDKSDLTLIREINDSVSYNKLDLTNRRITESEFYYLMPNDIIIISATKANYRSYRDLGLVSTILSSITTSIALISFIRTNEQQ
jgi:polysaccharide export outer membrane protein